jgi:hypothetical protein
VAWAVTASVAARNNPFRFDTRFPRTGGGEDIDWCLRLWQGDGARVVPGPGGWGQLPAVMPAGMLEHQRSTSGNALQQFPHPDSAPVSDTSTGTSAQGLVAVPEVRSTINSSQAESGNPLHELSMDTAPAGATTLLLLWSPNLHASYATEPSCAPTYVCSLSVGRSIHPCSLLLQSLWCKIYLSIYVCRLQLSTRGGEGASNCCGGVSFCGRLVTGS